MCRRSCRSLTVGEQVRAALGTMSSREAMRLDMDNRAGRICTRSARDSIAMRNVRDLRNGWHSSQRSKR